MQDRSARPDRSAAAQDAGTSMTVFGFFRQGSVVDPRGRVDTRPYKAGGRRRARGYAPLRGAAAARGSVVDPCGRVDTRPYEALRRPGVDRSGTSGRPTGSAR